MQGVNICFPESYEYFTRKNIQKILNSRRFFVLFLDISISMHCISLHWKTDVKEESAKEMLNRIMCILIRFL